MNLSTNIKIQLNNTHPKANKVDLIIKNYQTEKHNDLCVQLEKKSSDLKYLCGQIQAERNFQLEYSQILYGKHKQGFILVVEDLKDPSVLAGKVCIAVKEIIFRQQKLIAIYVYDLRIDPYYQRMGIAKKLINLAEKIGIEKYDAKIGYCTINMTNKRSQALFQNLGYNLANGSPRKILISIIHQNKLSLNNQEKYIKEQDENNKSIIVEKQIIFEKIEDPQFIEILVKKYYQDKDFFVHEYQSELISYKKHFGYYRSITPDNNNFAQKELHDFQNYKLDNESFFDPRDV